MQLIALVGAVALGIGSVDAVPQPASPPFHPGPHQQSKLTSTQAAPNAHAAREVPAKYLYRAKYHSRLPPVFVEPSVSIESFPAAPTTTTTTTPPSVNHAFPPGPYYRRPHVDSHTIEPIPTTTTAATTTSTAAPRPWFFRPGGSSNGTRAGGGATDRDNRLTGIRPGADSTDRDNRWPGIRGGGSGRGRNATNNLGGHPHGHDGGHWMTTSTTCTSHIVSVTLTQTINITVTATAAATWSPGGPMSYHTINGTLVPCRTTSTSTGTASSGASVSSHDHAWPWVWPRPPAPTAERTQTVTLTLSQATLTRTRTQSHTVTITDANGNVVAVPTACVIDPLMRPVVTGAGGHATTTTFVPATATVCPKSAPSGAPPKGSVYCGVRGQAVAEGSGHFLGRFEENAAGEELTLEGCWMFCEVSVPRERAGFFVYFANACCSGRRLELATHAARMVSTAMT